MNFSEGIVEETPFFRGLEEGIDGATTVCRVRRDEVRFRNELGTIALGFHRAIGSWTRHPLPSRNRKIALSFDFMRELVANPANPHDIPNGVALVLLSEGDPTSNAININDEIGLKALRAGHDLSFRYLRARLTSHEREEVGDRAAE
jgi:hypothetical protein